MPKRKDPKKALSDIATAPYASYLDPHERWHQLGSGDVLGEEEVDCSLTGTDPASSELSPTYVELPCNCAAPAVETNEGYECAYCGAHVYE